MANKYTNIDLSKYNKGYQASSKVNDAWNKKQKAEDAVSNYGDFNYSNQSAYQSVINDILNRKDFSYDMNADALYQQYKNQYQALGELAMQDTVGQVSALTGGYGNSYAATAGSQAYQSYLNQLNDKIPELWSLARSAYENDRAADYDKYGMLSADRQTQYGEWTDGLNRLLNERGYYSDNYNNVYNQDYSKWSDNRNYDQAQYWNEYNAGYQAERDAVADQQWKASYDYQVERDKVSDSQWKKQYEASVTNSTTTERKYMTKEQEQRYLEYINNGDYIGADNYLAVMAEQGLSPNEVGAWREYIPSEYRDPKTNEVTGNKVDTEKIEPAEKPWYEKIFK
jgi:hypothetical protein